jgi:hypothetical protein
MERLLSAMLRLVLLYTSSRVRHCCYFFVPLWIKAQNQVYCRSSFYFDRNIFKLTVQRGLPLVVSIPCSFFPLLSFYLGHVYFILLLRSYKQAAASVKCVCYLTVNGISIEIKIGFLK